PSPESLRAAKGTVANIEAMGAFLKVVSKLVGSKARPNPVPRGFVGFEVEDRDGSLAIKSVLANSPAARGGLRPGDLVAGVNGRKVGTVAELSAVLDSLPALQDATFQVRREAEELSVKVRTGQGL